MDNFTIQNLFPTPIYMTKINREFTKQELKFVEEQKKHCSKNQGNINTLRQTMELRSQIKITGGPKRCTNQNMEHYAFGKDHGNYQTLWKMEFEYEQTEVFGKDFGSLMRDLDFVPIEYELDETVILKTPCFITLDDKQKNIYFTYI